MIRRPPRSTRTDTLFPYTTLFRSDAQRSMNTYLGACVNLTPDDVRPAMIADAEVVYLERSEEHTSELQSLMRISYAVFCLKKKKKKTIQQTHKYSLIRKKTERDNKHSRTIETTPKREQQHTQ